MMSFDSKDLNLKKGEIGKAVEAQSPVVGQVYIYSIIIV